MRLTLLALLLAGCAGTTVYEGGQVVLRTQADIKTLNFRTAKGTAISAGEVFHSPATAAGGAAAAVAVTAVGGAVGNALATAIKL